MSVQRDGSTTWARASALARTALAAGATVNGVSTVTWDIRGCCTQAVRFETSARNPGPSGYERPMLRIEMHVPCRKCPACLWLRGRTWTERSTIECETWLRTWGGTLTLRPDERYLVDCAVYHKQEELKRPTDRITSVEMFALRHAEIGKYITLYLKRVRKAFGGKLRYLMVAEPHKNWFPHYHFLMHQCGYEPLAYDHLAGEKLPNGWRKQRWTWGFSKYNLIDVNDPLAVGYAAKYLAKSCRARVRASTAYGNTPLGLESENEREELTQQNK